MPQKSIEGRNVDNLKATLTCVYPDSSICPVCDHALVPQPLASFYVLDERTAEYPNKTFDVYILFFCTNCRQLFMVKYTGYSPKGSLTITCKNVSGIYPRTPKQTNFSEDISKLSSDFVKTYNQAETAEANNLSEIIGPGYRKALEFLIKDYLCSKNPEAEESIKSELLGNSLKRIKDERIQTLATKATWLGNDATHYVWKHEDYDIEDMKRFINAMLRYIESELAFDAALEVPFIK